MMYNIPEPYRQDYKGYVTLIELGGSGLNQNLKMYQNKLKEKYGGRFAEMLWDKFVRTYGNQ